MRTLLISILALSLAGCYTVDQTRLTRYVNDTLTPGMPLDQALVRMNVEEFNCDAASMAPAITCTRVQLHLPHKCLERVNLSARAVGSSKILATVEVVPVVCDKTVQ